MSRTAALARIAACAGLAMAVAAHADPMQRTEETWMAVGDNMLDSQRGGFDLGSGLMVSFGITRAVFINGELATQTTLNFGQLNNINAAQAAELNKQLTSLNLVQNGPGNTVQGPVGGVGGTIIQNTLNNQQIANRTEINVDTNGMSLMKQLNTGGALTDAISRSIGGR